MLLQHLGIYSWRMRKKKFKTKQYPSTAYANIAQLSTLWSNDNIKPNWANQNPNREAEKKTTKTRMLWVLRDRLTGKSVAIDGVTLIPSCSVDDLWKVITHLYECYDFFFVFVSFSLSCCWVYKGRTKDPFVYCRFMLVRETARLPALSNRWPLSHYTWARVSDNELMAAFYRP